MSITMSKTDNQNYACLINIHIHQRLLDDLLCGLQDGVSMRLGSFAGDIDRDVEISAIDTIIKLRKLTKEYGEIEDVELD